MPKALLAIAIFLAFTTLAFSQSGPRGFDNFDRSQGVPVYSPPPPPPAPATATASASKVTRRVKRNGRWVTITENASAVKKTASTSRVTDGVAARASNLNYPRTRLVMGSGSNLKGFTTGNAAHDKYIVESSQKYRIDPLLIYAQMHQESGFKIRATSHKGASGLMQLMPATARRFGVTKIYDPKQNIDAGVKYMRWLLDFFGQDVVLALAGYNAGEGAVLRYGRNVPPFRETQEYVRRISSRYNSISDPRYVDSVRASANQVATVEQKESRPLSVYEPSPLTYRTPDGKMILVNQ